MADQYRAWEMGSNFAEGISVTGLDALKAKLQALSNDMAHSTLEAALYAAANVYKDAIQKATPRAKDIYRRYVGKKKYILVIPGGARESVIIYKRKAKGMMQSLGDISLLVGYEKKRAFYMYWYEYGKKGQPARPFFRNTCDGIEAEAFAVARAMIEKRINEVS